VIHLDRESLLVHVSGDVRLADLERHLAERGLRLDVADAAHDHTIRDWLEAGAPGARNAWLDPADHLVAGFSARIRSSGASFSLRPAPRRAVGPDLLSLVLGLRGRMLALDSVWLRVHRNGVARPSAESFEPPDEPLNEDEKALFDAIAEALG
jgi:alkyldihydroxyacetonephosphate synthase